MAKAHNKKYSFIEAYNNPIDPEHYHSAIEPWDFIHANKLDFAQGNVIKYICRYKTKNGIEILCSHLFFNQHRLILLATA